MDALFVRVPDLMHSDRLDWGVVSPDSLLSLASFLNSQGLKCAILDLCADADLAGFPSQPETVARFDSLAEVVVLAIKTHQPSLVGFTALTNGDAWVATSVACRIKEAHPGLPVIMGGYFATANCGEIIASCPYIDAVVLGEGEYAALEILSRLKAGLEPFAAECPSLCYRNDGHPVMTPRSAPFDLKSCPPIDHCLLDSPRKYETHAYHTSRSCPWRCNYCLEAAMGTTYREKPVDRIRRDVADFRAHNENSFLLMTDPLVAVNDRRVRELCGALGDLGVNFLFQTRCDVISPDVVPLLKQSGCSGLFFGLESASYNTLLRMNKLRPPEYHQYQRYLAGAEQMVMACARSGVTPTYGVMLGYPGDTADDLVITLDFVRKLRSIYLDNIDARTGGCGFMVIGCHVSLPRHSAVWERRGTFAENGLELIEDGRDLFSDNKVKHASARLNSEQIMLFLRAFWSVGITASVRQGLAAPECSQCNRPISSCPSCRVLRVAMGCLDRSAPAQSDGIRNIPGESVVDYVTAAAPPHRGTGRPRADAH